MSRRIVHRRGRKAMVCAALGVMGLGCAAEVRAEDPLILDSSNSGGLAVLRADQNLVVTRPVLMKGYVEIDTGSFDVTLSGAVSSLDGSFVNLSTFGTGTLTFAGPVDLPGWIDLRYGGLRLAGDGRFVRPLDLITGVWPGTTFTIDNTANNINDRVPADMYIMAMAGFTYLGNATTDSFEHLGSVEAGSITVGAGENHSAAVWVGETNPRLYRGTNLGAAPPGTPNVANIIGQCGEMVGSGGARGSTYQDIIRGAMGDTSPTRTGTSFVTYDAATGVRPLDLNSEYASTIVNGGSVLHNVRLAGTVAGIDSPTAINSLIMEAGGSISGNSSLLIRSGMVVVNGSNGGIRVGSLLFKGRDTSPEPPGAAAYGDPDAYLITHADLTISGAVSGSSRLIKEGAGQLTIAGPADFPAGFEVREGTLRLAGDRLSYRSPWTLQISAGAVLDVGNSDMSTPGASVEGQLVLGGGTVSARSISGSGVIKGSGGIDATEWVSLSGQLSYTGPTTITGGLLQLSGDASLVNSSKVTLNGSLLLDNTNTNVPDRFPDEAPVAIADAVIAITGTGSKETIGQVNVEQGYCRIGGADGVYRGEYDPPGAGELTVASIHRGRGALIDFGGPVIIKRPPLDDLVGGVLPYATTNGMPASIDTASGAVLPAKMIEGFGGATAASNVNVSSADGAALVGTTAINALRVWNRTLSSPSGVSSTIRVASGQVIVNEATIRAGDGGRLALDFAGRPAYIFMAEYQNGSTIAADIVNVGQEGLTIGGGMGTIALSGRNTMPSLSVVGLASYSAGSGIFCVGPTVSFASDENLGAPGGPISLKASSLQFTGPGKVVSNREVSLATSSTYAHHIDVTEPTGVYELTGQLTGGGVFEKWGQGTLVLSGGAALSGEIYLYQGALEIRSRVVADRYIEAFDMPTPTATPAVLTMDIGGYRPGVEYGQLVTTGDAGTAGSLRISFVDGFVPRVGDEFKIFDFANLMCGGFEAIDVTGLPTGWSVDTSAMYTTGVITVVPEPGLVAWLTVVGAVLAGRRRRSSALRAPTE